jgi:GAF domain-containing protein
LAVPILVRHVPAAVVVYGSRANGEHIDPDEEELLEGLCNAAGSALDRLQSLERIHELQAEVEVLRASARASPRSV